MTGNFLKDMSLKLEAQICQLGANIHKWFGLCDLLGLGGCFGLFLLAVILTCGVYYYIT